VIGVKVRVTLFLFIYQGEEVVWKIPDDWGRLDGRTTLESFLAISAHHS